MTSDCPTNSRKLDSDGTVLVCVTPHMDHEVNGDRPLIHYVTTGNDGRGLVLHAWPDDHPCAWSATCPDCGGLSTRSPTSNPGRSAPCGTCDGAGTVDTIPARLIGEGTRLRHCDHDINGWGDVILIARDEYGDWFARPVEAEPNGGYLRIGDRHIGNEYEWRVLRAVPPAGDTT